MTSYEESLAADQALVDAITRAIVARARYNISPRMVSKDQAINEARGHVQMLCGDHNISALTIDATREIECSPVRGSHD